VLDVTLVSFAAAELLLTAGLRVLASKTQAGQEPPWRSRWLSAQVMLRDDLTPAAAWLGVVDLSNSWS
jgi:hypothetical protein